MCKEKIKLAEEIRDKCPLELGKEIIIIGSVSRGYADEYSDVEIEFLVDNIIPECDRITWIKSIGGTDICPYPAPLSDGSEWIIFKYTGCWIESGWQKINDMKEILTEVMQGKSCSHERLVLTSAIKSAIIIRNSGIISSLQKDLFNYPKELARNIIINTVHPWNIELGLTARRTLSRRDDKIPLLQSMIGDINRVLRILFAINMQWEPDWKWTKYIVRNLNIKPENLLARIDSIICLTDSEKNFNNCLALIYDALELIPEELKEEPEIKKAIENIKLFQK